MRRQNTALFMAVIMTFVQLQGTGVTLAAEEEPLFLEETGEESLAGDPFSEEGFPEEAIISSWRKIWMSRFL